MNTTLVTFDTGILPRANGDISREGISPEGRAWMIFPRGYSGYMPARNEQVIVHWTQGPWNTVIVHKCENVPASKEA